MTSYVNESVATISSVMEEATHTIHEEVEKVKVSVEDYVLISNEQFAKENDFVKYQLAGKLFLNAISANQPDARNKYTCTVGTFTLIGCLISLWHLTSHQRHLSKPDIQRRVMAVLWMVPVYSKQPALNSHY